MAAALPAAAKATTGPSKATVAADTSASKTGSNGSGKRRFRHLQHQKSQQQQQLKHYQDAGNYKRQQNATKKLATTSATAAGGGNRRKRTKDYQDTEVDTELDKYPYCIVWTPLPIVTWFIPIIGHTGIANSKGVIYDFSDDYDVTVDNFAFGTPTKFYQFHPDQIPNGAEAWDKAIQETADYYSKTRHSLFFNNCHQYIAGVLNKVKYSGRTDWTQTGVWWKITFRSVYTGCLGFFRQWWPFSVLMTGALLFLSAAL